MIGIESAACLRPLMPDLRHHRPMGSGKNRERNPWLRMTEWIHVSAWLPPGLALAWLATLATLVHNVSIALADWGATVSLVVLVVLVAQRPRVPPGIGSPGTATGQTVSRSTVATVPGNSGALSPPPTAAEFPDKGEGPHGSVTNPTTHVDAAAVPASRSPDLSSEPKPGPPIATSLIPSELRVLTAEEVASVLRVDIGLVITSISNGQLPGNRLGSHWRIDQGALMRWLRGPYGDVAGKDPNQ